MHRGNDVLLCHNHVSCMWKETELINRPQMICSHPCFDTDDENIQQSLPEN
jgi:hypothetical protein